MKLILTGGGTGGHIFPALCVAEEFLSTYRDSNVLFVGAEGGMEEKLVRDRGFPLKILKVRGIRGKDVKETVKNLILAFSIIPSCIRILREENPDAVIGFGGYASGPFVFTASIMNFITAIHEQNSIPGLTNRVLGKFVDRIFISFAESARFFNKDKTIESGMPVRKSLIDLQPVDQRSERFTVLIIGGSQGARTINKMMIKMVDEFDWIKNEVYLIHQTGKWDKNMVEEKYRSSGVEAEVYEFIDDMEKIYPRVDLVIARAGASTLAELSAIGKPSILIPYPFAAGNHQVFNAKKFYIAGAGEVILESELTPEKLAETLKSIMRSPEKQKKMGENAKALFKRNSARIIVENVVGLIRERKASLV